MNTNVGEEELTEEQQAVAAVKAKAERGEELTVADLKLLMPITFDEEGNLQVRVSKRATATVRELNGQESMRADAMLPGQSSTNAELKYKTYALFALVKLVIDGAIVPLPPVDKAGVNVGARAKAMNAAEIEALGQAYFFHFMMPADPEELKN